MKRFYVVCMVVFLLLSMPLAGHAESTDEDVRITYNGTQVYVDGKRIKLTDSSGNKLDPFLYNGTIYLPYEVLKKAIDKPVIWDKKALTINIGGQDEETPAMLLTDLDMFNYQGDWARREDWDANENADATGVSYHSAIVGNLRSDHEGAIVYTEYLLNQKYKRLAGTYFLEYDSRFCRSTIALSIYGDDELLRSYDMTAGTIPIYFDDVDVTGVVKLRVAFTVKEARGGYEERYWVALGNPSLY